MAKANSAVATQNPVQDLTAFSFDALDAMEGIEFPSSELVDKEDLIKVPLIITRVVFRQGDQSPVGYVSCEVVTREGHIVFNDGSTGIHSQLLQLAVMHGIFTPDVIDDNGRVRRDIDLAEFVGDSAEMRFDSAGQWAISWTLPAPLKARNGLRKSSYASRVVNGETIPGGTTFYLA